MQGIDRLVEEQQYKTLKEFRTGKFAINELTTVGKLHKHHEIREEKGTFVSQFEKTFMVLENGIEVFN